MNMPSLPGADELIVPLNVVEGGLASPNDTDPTKALPLSNHMELPPTIGADFAEQLAKALVSAMQQAQPQAKALPEGEGRQSGPFGSGREVRIRVKARPEVERSIAEVLSRFCNRQRETYIGELAKLDLEGIDLVAAIKRIYEEKSGTWLGDVISDLYDCAKQPIASAATRSMAMLGVDPDGLDESNVVKLATDLCRKHAHSIAQSALDSLVDAASAVDAPNARSVRARARHILFPLDGGALWPGDTSLPPEETCNCHCRIDIVTGGKARFRERRTRDVTRELGLDDFNESKLDAAIMRFQQTVDCDGRLWEELTPQERSSVLDELRTRDRDWVAFGKVPEPSYATPRIKKSVTVDNPWEGRSGEHVAEHGIRPDFIVDYRFYRDENGIKRRIGLPDLASGVELKTPRESRNAVSAIKNCLESTEAKEGVVRLVIDTAEAKYLEDDKVWTAILDLVDEYELPLVSMLDKKGVLKNCMKKRT